MGIPLDLVATQPATSRPAKAVQTMMEEADFGAFYSRTAKSLRGYLRAALGDVTRADDVMQEAYLRFLRSEFTSDDPEYQKNYLFRIATNLLRDRYRRKKREEVLPLKTEGLEPSPEKDVELKADMLTMMSQVKPRDRKMLWLAYVEGSTHDEIAEIMGLKSASIRSMLFRARKRLADVLRCGGFNSQMRGGGGS